MVILKSTATFLSIGVTPPEKPMRRIFKKFDMSILSKLKAWYLRKHLNEVLNKIRHVGDKAHQALNKYDVFDIRYQNKAPQTH